LNNQNNIKSIVRSVAELLKIPEDVACGDTRIAIIGKTKVKIENYRNIMVYSEAMVKIRTKQETLEISGEELRIRYYDQDEMEIVGKIGCVKMK